MQMVFLDVVFLPSRATLYTTFLEDCGRGESLKTTMCGWGKARASSI